MTTAAEAPPRRGHLRIYLGAAPGVGKTYAMLGEARRNAERGADVVVGLVETHDRPRTAALLDDFEILPRRHVSYRGIELTELDVDAVLARRPAVVLVDELAHANAPGSRNDKRWQDIDELLAAGVDVLSTVNVQHLESLNEVMESLTGLRPRETVPDEWVRGAKQIELVDITPEALRRRMAHGNIYPPEKVDAALSNYFRPVNLVALRELTLLWLADEVDVALRRYRAEQRITEVWDTRERIVVAVTDGPQSETVLRRAAKIATRASSVMQPGRGGADLLCVHVLRGDGLVEAPPGALDRLRRLADDVGASFHTVVDGADLPTALLEFARGANATQLVLGTSRRSRLARLFNPGVGAKVVPESGSIDVHMMSHEHTDGGPAWRRFQPRAAGTLPLNRLAAGWMLAVLGPAATTAIGVSGASLFGLTTDIVLFFLTSVLVALVGGLGPGLLAAMASGPLLDYFLTLPRYTFTIAERDNAIALVGMVIVAVAVAMVIHRAARRATQAAQSRTEAALLASFARTVLTRVDPLPRLLEKVSETFGLRSIALLERPAEENMSWHYAACLGSPDCQRPEDADIDIEVDPDTHLIAQGRPLAAGMRRVLETVGGQALLALRAQRMATETAAARRVSDGAQLRTTLLSAVGNDLRTPLTSIKASAESLRGTDRHLSAPDQAALLATIETSADRLTHLVENLLESVRMAAGAITPRVQPVAYEEVVSPALAAVDEAHRVAVEIDESVPAVLADADLLENAVTALASGWPVVSPKPWKAHSRPKKPPAVGSPS